MGDVLERMWNNPKIILCRRETDKALVLARFDPDGGWMARSDGQSRGWLTKNPWPDSDEGYRIVEVVKEGKG